MKTKLTSRKFWIAVTGIITSVIMMLNADENLTQMVSATLLMISDIVIYIYGESQIDKENINDHL